MRSRAWLLWTAASIAAVAPAYLACSSSASDDTAPGASDSGVVPFDATTPDTSPPPDDAALDAGDGEAEAGSSVHGKCEPVQGTACDLVIQDCPNSSDGTPQECVVVTGSTGKSTTGCTPITSSEHLGAGHGCCPGQSGAKQCDPGLECIGDISMPCDGGVPAGRCTPHCCGTQADGGNDDYLCGQSDPEGYQGHCDTQVVDGTGNALFNACTYTQACQPFGIKACPPGFACEVRDKTGSAGCDDIFVPDGGPPPGEGEACVALNNCQDGLVCLDNGDGTSSCYMMCVTPGSKPPFDAGALDGGPFYGGCNTGKSCSISVQGFPPWISFCQ